MSISGELQTVLPTVVNGPEPCPVATPVTPNIDPHHPNQEVQLEQINEGEMIENKLVIPDEMERYLSQVAAILDAEEPTITELTPANPKPENKTEDINSCCNSEKTQTTVQAVQPAQPFNEFNSNNEDLTKTPVKPNRTVQNPPSAQTENKPPVPNQNVNRNYVNYHQVNQNCTPHNHEHYSHYYHQNYHYCQQNQGNHYHPPPNYPMMQNQPNRLPERNGYNYSNYRCHSNPNRSVQSNPVHQPSYPIQNQNITQPPVVQHNHQMCQNHCYPQDHCSSYQQNNCCSGCQPNSLPQCSNTQIHNCTTNNHHVTPLLPMAPPTVPTVNHAPPPQTQMIPNPMQQHSNCSCNHNENKQQNCAQQHKMCGNCHYTDNNDNFKENEKMYKNYNDNYREIETEIQCTDISQSEVRMPREAYQRTLEYVQQCQIWSNEVSSSTHPTSNMVVNDLTSSLNSLAQENRFFQQMIH